MQQEKLRKIAANITSISQERQLLTNWLSSRSQSTGGQGRLTNRISEHEDDTTQVVNDNPSTKSGTLILDNDDNNKSNVAVADNSQQTKTMRIRLPHSPFNKMVNNSNMQPRLIPYSTVSTGNYQCGRLLKKHSITVGYQERETTAFQSLSPSPQLRIIQTSRKRVRVNNIQIHCGQKKTKRHSY